MFSTSLPFLPAVFASFFSQFCPQGIGVIAFDAFVARVDSNGVFSEVGGDILLG